ncbi:MAG: cyclic nucleotide-binding domain-containing protein [Hyphomicrobiales bacterium]
MSATSDADLRTRRLALPVGRIGHLVVSGFLIATANTFGSSLAAARFLAGQGGQGISTYYVVFALLSVPAWLAYSQFIDRGNRAVLLQRYMAAMAAATALLTAASMAGGAVADYALYAGISVLEQLLFSLYMVMLTDYLTAREMTRFSTRITVSLSAGAMIGGTMAGLLSDLVAPAWLLFGMPPMLLGCLTHLAWLSRRWPPAGEWTAMNEGSILDSLRGIGRILRGVGIAVLLSAAVFLNIATQCVSEYMVFGIYAESFPDEQALARFFGLMSGALNLAAVLIGLGLTAPLMRRLGVARMNLFFPASLGISFVAMMASPVLGVAMFAHVVYDGFSNNVDAPVMAVNYNAVPSRYVGQVRVFNDSLIYPIALAVSGLLIWLVEAQSGFYGVGILGLVSSGAFIAVGWLLGRNYMRGLIGILQDGAVDLDRSDFMTAEAPKVAVRQQAALEAMLAGDDPSAADVALRIVARADLRPFLTLVGRRLVAGGSAAVTILARSGDRHAAALLSLWPAADTGLRLRIAEYLAAVGQALPPDAAGTPVMDALARAAAPGLRPDVIQHLTELARASRPIAAVLLPVAVVRRDPGFVPLLVAVAQAHPDLERAALRGLAELPVPETPASRIPDDFIAAAIMSPDAERRESGYRLAALALWPPARIVDGLKDADALVRHAAIAALRGTPESIEVLRPLLQSEAPRTRLAAIEALGKADATDELFTYLQDTAFPRIAAFRSWRSSLPRGQASWVQVARLAMAEADAEAIEEVLQTLDALGHEQTVRYIRRFIAAGDARMRARAAEAISAFDERKLVLPLLPLLDEAPAKGTKKLSQAAIVAQMKTSTSPWLRRAAALAKSKETAMSVAEQGLLDRLLFLRKVALFESCTLDDLYAIHQVMTRSDYRDGDRIVEEGSQGEQLFVLLEGAAKVGRGAAQGFIEYSRLQPGAAFGEMALFGDGIRTADVVAVGRASCLALDRLHFDDLVRQQPGILVQMCRLFASRLQAANKGVQALQAEG